ncbi:MAG: hypothetical protein ABIL68_09520 [bacterium]
MNAILDKKNFKETDLPHIIAKTYWPIILKQFSVKLILEKDHRKDFESIMKQLSLITIGAHISKPGDLEIQEIENLFRNIELLMYVSIQQTKTFIPEKIKNISTKLLKNLKHYI